MNNFNLATLFTVGSIILGSGSLSFAQDISGRSWHPLYVCENGRATIDMDQSSGDVQFVLRDSQLAGHFNSMAKFRGRFLFWHYPETDASVLMHRDENGNLDSALPGAVLYFHDYLGLTLREEAGSATRTLRWVQVNGIPTVCETDYTFRDCKRIR